MKFLKLFAAVPVVLLLAGNVQAAFVWNGQNGAPAPGQFVQVKLQDYEVALLPYNSTTDGPGSANPLTQWSVQDIVQRAIPLGFINSVTGMNSGNSYYPGSTGSIVGDQLYSIFSVTTINSAVGGQQFWLDAANQHLQGVFYGLTVSSVTGSGGTATYNFTGGNMNLYFNGNVADPFTATTGPWTSGWNGIALANGVGAAGDTLVLSANGVGGVAANTATTLTSTLNALNVSNDHFTGVGNGFLTDTLDNTFHFAIDGVDSSTFSPPYPGNQSIEFQSNFNNQPTGYTSPQNFQNSTGWSVSSQDPVTGAIQTPEPASLALLASGGLLAGVFGLRRRRKS